MFEKEAGEYVKAFTDRSHIWSNDKLMQLQLREAYKNGAEFGYNKANEWHYVKDGDLPERGDADFIRILIVHHNHITIANYDGDWKSTAGHKISIPYAWKELPKELKENE